MMPQRILVPWALGCVLFLSAPASAGTSNSLLDVSADGKWLLTASPDNDTVTLIDIAARKKLREIQVGRKPESVAWIGSGPLALVSLYEESALALIDAQTGKVIDRIPVGAEPYGLVVDRAGERAWATLEYPGEIVQVDIRGRKVTGRVKAGSFLRGLALSPDEQRLYTTEFYTCVLHAVELKADGGMRVADTWPAQRADNLCRNVVLHPTRPKAYLSQIRSRTGVADSNGSIFPHLAICDLTQSAAGSRRVSLAMDTYNGVRVVTNPWEAAISPDGTRLYTIYAGTNDMNVSRVIDDDYTEVERIGRAVIVGQNPRAVRVHPAGKEIYVYNALDFNVTVHDPQSLEKLATIPVCTAPHTPEWVRGKILFNTARPPMTSRLWVACSSCHPDGHTDGRVWQNPEGLRKTTALFGLAHTHPLHWSADRDEVQDFEYTIRGRLMQGRGLLRGEMKTKRDFEKTELSENLAGRSKDLDALALYCNSFEFTLSPHIPAPGQLTAAAARGKKLFFSKEVGCVNCHSGPYFTDSSLTKPFHLHDVGTGADDATEKMGPLYDTPTLLGIYRTAPYLHHGKAATLRDVLTTANPHDKHGHTSQLSSQSLDDLVEFLKSLPYEQPPTQTPNTVKNRILLHAARGNEE
jgi:YVTN family beta-propeller protein